jgi:hypothetical protein
VRESISELQTLFKEREKLWTDFEKDVEAMREAFSSIFNTTFDCMTLVAPDLEAYRNLPTEFERMLAQADKESKRLGSGKEKKGVSEKMLQGLLAKLA